jgi:hypothetical protein
VPQADWFEWDNVPPSYAAPFTAAKFCGRQVRGFHAIANHALSAKTIDARADPGNEMLGFVSSRPAFVS